MTKKQREKIMTFNLMLVSDDKNLLKDSMQTDAEYQQEKTKAYKDLLEFIRAYTPRNN
jgi:hypothetical protein